MNRRFLAVNTGVVARILFFLRCLSSIHIPAYIKAKRMLIIFVAGRSTTSSGNKVKWVESIFKYADSKRSSLRKVNIVSMFEELRIIFLAENREMCLIILFIASICDKLLYTLGKKIKGPQNRGRKIIDFWTVATSGEKIVQQSGWSYFKG